MNVYQTTYSEHTIEFELHRKMVKHVNLNVKPENKTEKEFISGETFKYLVKQYRLYRLKVKQTDEKEEIKL
ncbi:hypothetical protein [Haloplasma contractile]|uniref:Uncharacterized protein n=1 Tax=Haloplasma contractile SSD-17B TaxID=1033810 RepID=U2E843_9MOLU|nr:hypothetical protein [Haloplasma contractile]ERJ11041.1 hypothetical protein HLPCO_002932 [Haloplasma contractile SSD-17B]